ncbi:hypothetical protein GCM10010411_76850 [Actinomadura fulvescens]|uniref:IrrE N-terminal-like domain-containing protein n=1 Tax=Actinomadura fulvescens TaxID=46160 RepID=A0ABP6CU98_9ACTN
MTRRCRELVDSLDIPYPWDLDQFAAEISSITGRPLRIGPPLPAQPGGPCGMLVRTLTTDWVNAVPGVSKWHYYTIALHEMGHAALDHHSDLDVTGLATLTRNSYDTQEEREAELFATLVQQRVWRLRRKRGERA